MAELFSDKIWTIVGGWDYFTKKGMGLQITGAADSISANIAEGYGRHHYGESRNFYFYARGSALECKAWLGKCKRRNLADDKVCDELLQELEIILAKLINYIKFVERSQKAAKKL